MRLDTVFGVRLWTLWLSTTSLLDWRVQSALQLLGDSNGQGCA